MFVAHLPLKTGTEVQDQYNNKKVGICKYRLAKTKITFDWFLKLIWITIYILK